MKKKLSPAAGAVPIQLNEIFWKRFSKTIWEKKAAAFKNISAPLLEMDQVEIFKMLVLFSDRCRKSKNADGMKFYIEGHRQFESEVLRLLPRKSDQSLNGYHARMNELFPDYCLVCDELLQVNHAKQTQLAQLTNDLYKQVGLPNRFTEMGLYLGNYRKTPFGVHVDGCGVFSFPVVGHKKFRIWKPAYVEKHPRLKQASSYSKYKDGSVVLTAQPGDMTYWPSVDWHIAESNGSFSATWSLGVWVDQQHDEDVSKIVAALVNDNSGHQISAGLTPFKTLHESSGEVRDLPDLYRKSVADLSRLSPKRIETAFLKAWMIHASKQGFKTIPKTVLTITPTSNLRLSQKSLPIRWLNDKNENRFYYCFNGEVTEGLASKRFLKFIKALNSGQTRSLASLVNSASKSPEFEALKILANAGAFA